MLITFSYNKLKYQLGLLLLLLLGAGIFLHEKKRTKAFLRYIKRFIPLRESFSNRLKLGFEELYEHMPRKRQIIIPFVFSLINWSFIYAGVWIIAHSLGVFIEYWRFAMLYSIGTIAGLLPITVSGLGTREAALILLFKNYNLSSEHIVSISLMAMFICGIIPAFLGWMLSITKK